MTTAVCRFSNYNAVQQQHKQNDNDHIKYIYNKVKINFIACHACSLIIDCNSLFY